MIDSKHWSGSVVVRDDVLMQNGRKREQAVAGAAEAALAVTGLLGGIPATGVLCFVREEPLTGWARDVMVCSTATVVAMLRSRPAVLHPGWVAQLGPQLELQLTRAAGNPAQQWDAARPPAPRPVTRPVRRPARTPRGRSRKAATPSVGKLVGLLAAALLMLTVGPPLLSGMSRAVSTAVQHQLAPTAPFGATIAMKENSARPALELTAARPENTRPRRHQPRPAAGQHLVAVHLRIVDRGTQQWSFGSSGTHLSVLDQNGIRYSADPRHRGVTAGRLFPAGGVLRPGKRAEGYLVFELPVGAQVAQVDLFAGPGLPETARWTSTD